MAVIYGIDVSHHQGAVDWRRVAADGVTFGVCKASEGTSFVDSTVVANLAGARAAGLVTGAYHFLQPGSGAAQARHFLGAVGDPTGLLLAVDVERTSSGGQPTRADAAAWIAEVRRQLGSRRPLVLYTGRWYWSGVLGDPDATGLGVRLWESRYVSAVGPWRHVAAHTPAGWLGEVRCGGLRPTILQCSSSATVAGVSGPVDLDVYPGSRAQLLALTRSAPAPAGPDHEEETVRIIRRTDGLAYVLLPSGLRGISGEELAALRKAGVPEATGLSQAEIDLIRDVVGG